MSGVALVQFSYLDLGKFIKIARLTLDKNPASTPDSAGFDPPLHHALCVAALMGDISPKSEECRDILSLLQAGFMFAVDDRYTAEVLSVASMASILVPTVERGVELAFVSGTLLQWREALVRGSSRKVSMAVRDIYNKVFREFKTARLSGAFDLKIVQQPDQTFLLEYKK